MFKVKWQFYLSSCQRTGTSSLVFGILSKEEISHLFLNPYTLVVEINDVVYVRMWGQQNSFVICKGVIEDYM